MNRSKLVRTATIFLCSLVSPAQEKGLWRPVSKTARSITGDVAFGGDKISINLSSFTVAQIRALTAPEILTAFNVDAPPTGVGNLYRTDIPSTKKFAGRNTLCGSENAQWIATYVSGKDLNIAIFSGSAMPVFTVAAMANTTSLCGTFTYTR